MRKAPSNTALQEAGKAREISSDLIDRSRAKVGGLLERHVFVLLDQFEAHSREYENHPSDDKLLKMAEIILPISKETASTYCKMVLERNSLHEGAKDFMKRLG
jgi:hypothetical protein